MRAIKALILVFGLSITTTMAGADEHPGAVLVLDAGESSCGSWTSTSKRNNYQDEAWLFGFITAYNMYIMKTSITGATDKQGLAGWVDNYCRTHPLNSIFDAAVELIEELKRRMSQEAPLH
jgi:hypothetical protein